jgi:ATP-dependent 26S proteasome regulatory subunit
MINNSNSNSNRNKHKKNGGRFKSYTDINNYNNFLLELDKKQKDLIPNPNNECINGECPNKCPNKCPNNECINEYKKKEIKNLVKHIGKEFVASDYNDKNFTGLSRWESLLDAVEQQLDPNIYINDSIINDSIINDSKTNNSPIKSVTPKIHIYTKKVNIVSEINNINDLLKIIETYPNDKYTEYNIDIEALHKIKIPLNELQNMIGMKALKENIVDQIIFYIQNLHTINSDIKGNDFMHTVIYGPPGSGKTEIAKIIGSIFSKMGVLSKGTFKKVTRADLIAGYLGQTALKTRDVVKEALGGVLFIDEAYALGNEEKRDSFSKECIDTLCESLSDHKDNLMVIVAGYETDLNNCFFNYNQGLNSRFTWRFKTDEYTGDDLYKIFLKKVLDGGWSIAEDSKIDTKWFEKNKSHLKFYGRDVETLFAKTKIAHSRRVFCLDKTVKKILILKDLDKGLEIYLRNEDSKNKEKERHKSIISSMYI